MEYLQEWEKVRLAEPLWLLLFLLFPIFYWLKKKSNSEGTTLLFPTLSRVKKSNPKTPEQKTLEAIRSNTSTIVKIMEFHLFLIIILVLWGLYTLYKL